MLDPNDRSACEPCPRKASGSRCRASSLHHIRRKSEILWVYAQPDPLDVGAIEPGVHGATFSVMQAALTAVHWTAPELRRYHIRKTYASQCVPAIPDEKPNKAVLEACQPLFQSVLEETQPSLIVAFGATALRQLGVKAKHTSVRGRILEPADTGLPAPLLVTFSERAVTAAPGIFETFKQDLRNGYNRLERGVSSDTTLDELTKDYVMPATMDEAIALMHEILASPETNTLSVDTETTSLRPEKEGAKIIAFCFSWAVGKATTILFDHPHAPPEYLERLPELEVLIRRLLASRRPKVLHNAKFDLKWIELRYKMPVNNVVWCTLLGEHLLDEDKKGNYGLKALTAVWMPKYCGYEDKLQDLLEDNDPDKIQKVDSKLETLGEEHPDFANALVEYKSEYSAYQERKAAWTALADAYAHELAEYHAKKAAHKEAVEAWEALPKRGKKPEKPRKPTGTDTVTGYDGYVEALRDYELALEAWNAWERPEKPVKDFAKPEKPLALEKPPVEPKDPRSRKEKDYNTDGGYEKVAIPTLQLYGGVDGDVTRRLSSIQLTRLEEEATVGIPDDEKEKMRANGTLPKSPCRPLMRTHAIPASRVLGEMEFYGTSIDQAYIPKLHDDLTKVIDENYALLTQLAPGLNFGSNQQLGALLYDTGWTHTDGTHVPPLVCLARTKTGQRSTAEIALKPYLEYDEHVEINPKTGKKDTIKTPRHDSLFLHTLFLWKKALKARDTFLMNLRVLSKRDGKIHTSFHINGTGTGRLSSSDMNLQNIPKALGGFNIKKLFIADSPDMVFVNADYKGAEVRVFTAYAPDPALIKALNDGLDMHSFFASKVFLNPYEDYEDRANDASPLSKDYRKQLDSERTRIKRVVFGILYGAGPGKIAETIGVSLDEGRELIELLFTMFPAIRDYIEEIKCLVRRDGYVETHFGRRRRFPLTVTSRHQTRAERQAQNFKIQSTSSDIVIAQLIEIAGVIASDKTWPEWGIHKPLHTYGVRLLLTVHDSICLQWPKKLINSLTPWLTHYGETRVREKFPWLPVPFKMDIEIGDSYGQCMAVSKYLAGMPADYFDEGLYEEREMLNELREDAFAPT